MKYALFFAAIFSCSIAIASSARWQRLEGRGYVYKVPGSATVLSETGSPSSIFVTYGGRSASGYRVLLHQNGVTTQFTCESPCRKAYSTILNLIPGRPGDGDVLVQEGSVLDLVFKDAIEGNLKTPLELAALKASEGFIPPKKEKCDLTSVILKNVILEWDFQGRPIISGSILNSCQVATGVQIKITVSNEAGAQIEEFDIWPFGESSNVDPGQNQPFQIVLQPSFKGTKIGARVIAVKRF